MRIRAIGLVATTIVALGLGCGQAWAGNQQVNGQGQTPLSASIGFNADDTLAGELTYNADPNGATPEFKAQCDDFTSAVFKTRSTGAQSAYLTATCTDQDGATVYFRGLFVDRGEPGVADSVCLLWSYHPVPRESNAYIHEMGKISNGNIQIHM